MSTWRDALTTTDVSGCTYFQSAYLDAVGKIISLTSGQRQVDKYIRNDLTEVRYKRISYAGSLINANGTLYQTLDDLTFTSPTTNMPSPTGSPIYTNGYWFCGRIGNGIYRSTDKINWTQVCSTSRSFDNFGYDGNGNMVAISANSNANWYYSNDNGATWNLSTATLNANIQGCCYFKGKFCFFTTTMSGSWVSYINICSSANDASPVSYTDSMTDTMHMFMRVTPDGNTLFFGSWYGPASYYYIYSTTTLPTGNSWHYGSVGTMNGVSNPSQLVLSVSNSAFICSVYGKLFMSNMSGYSSINFYQPYGCWYNSLTGKWYFTGYHQFLYNYHMLSSIDQVTWVDETANLINNPSLGTLWQYGERTS